MFKIIGADQKEYGPISTEQIRQWIKDGRLNAQTPAQRDGGEWKQLGAYAEFGDLFGMAAAAEPGPAPSAAPISSAPSPLPAGGGSREAALQAVKGPAMALAITGGLGILFYLFSSVLHLAGYHPPISPNAPPEWRHFLQQSQSGTSALLSALLGVAINAFVLLGGFKMMRLESRGVAFAACIVAMLPCQCCCLLGLPFGIWALVVINKPEVKSQFTS